MNKRDIITIAVLAIIFGIIILIALINKDEEKIKQKSEYEELTLLTDEDLFLSISKNINKISVYANSNNQALNFIMKSNINSNDYKNISFQAEQIYVISNLSLYKYYVKGNIYKENVDTISTFVKEEYFILNYDMDNNSYNIEIIDEDRYKNASNEEYVFEVINRNDYNNFEYTSLNPKARATMYFNDFLNKMYLSPEEAYNLLSKDTKNNYFNTYNDFKNFIINYNNISLKEYSVDNNKIGIKDNNNIEYIFEITYILKYNVIINKTEE